jgi:hypothetical protein
MSPAGFEAAIPAKERPWTHAVEGAATRIGSEVFKKQISKVLIIPVEQRIRLQCYKYLSYRNPVFCTQDCTSDFYPAENASELRNLQKRTAEG